MRAILETLCASLLLSSASTADLFSLSGGEVPPRGDVPVLVRFDRDSLLVEAGFPLNGTGSKNDLAMDETGRVFGICNQCLFEYDPQTLQVLRQRTNSGSLAGVAARAGKIYTLTGIDDTNLALVVYGANNFAQIGGPQIQDRLGGGNDLAFDENGRLFGISNDWLLEFDPESLERINLRRKPGLHLAGIAVHGGLIYSITGNSSPALVTFDANSLQHLSGVVQDESTGRHDLAFDGGGRLFGICAGCLFEFDPLTLEIVNEQAFSGTSEGIAAERTRPPAETLEPISSITRDDTTIRLTIPLAFRRQIGVEYSPDLSPGSWIGLGNVFEADGVGVFEDSDSVRLGREHAYYRAFLRPLAPQ